VISQNSLTLGTEFREYIEVKGLPFILGFNFLTIGFMKKHIALTAANVVATTAFAALLALTICPMTSVAADPPTQAPAPNQSPSKSSPTPPAVPAPDLADGKLVYSKYCSLCHGDDGHGAMGPPVANTKLSDAQATDIIVHGTKHGMPALGKRLTAAQIADVVAYEDTFGKK
jgi:mono/diheme cytochrome c family protein